MRTGFIGLGNMGLGMASNLVSKGFQVTVRDVRPEPVAQLVATGASAAASNEELGRQSDVVSIAVFDEAQVFDAVFAVEGDAGLLAGMAPGGTLLLHPTIAPSAIRRVADAGAEREISVLDVPMTGGANVAAAEGTLTFMVGGDAAVLERVRPVLDAMATSVFHVGALGAGAAAKIINNYFAGSHCLLVREALRLAKGMGMDEEDILRILNTGGVGSNWATHNWERIKAQEKGYTTGPAGMVAMVTKDMKLAQRLSEEVGAHTPALAALIDSGLPDMERSGLTDNGLQRPSDAGTAAAREVP